MDDPHDLERFVAAQDAAGTYNRALGELRTGRKQTHWMWFVFAQVDGLGASEMSRRFALSGLDEARAYLRHPVLGPRVRECVLALLDLEERDAVAVFGSGDAKKLRSSMTIFDLAAPDEELFSTVLCEFFEGKRDPATAELVQQRHPPERRIGCREPYVSERSCDSAGPNRERNPARAPGEPARRIRQAGAADDPATGDRSAPTSGHEGCERGRIRAGRHGATWNHGCWGDRRCRGGCSHHPAPLPPWAGRDPPARVAVWACVASGHERPHGGCCTAS